MSESRAARRPLRSPTTRPAGARLSYRTRLTALAKPDGLALLVAAEVLDDLGELHAALGKVAAWGDFTPAERYGFVHCARPPGVPLAVEDLGLQGQPVVGVACYC